MRNDPLLYESDNDDNSSFDLNELNILNLFVEDHPKRKPTKQ